MAYLLKLRLCGRVCDKCEDPLAGVKVRLYDSVAENVAALAAANPKSTFAAVGEKEISKKSARLVGEGTTDELGRLDVALGKKYDGGAFDVDIEVEGEGGKTRQFHLTTLAPAWLRQGDTLVAAWEHCLPVRVWCRILALLGRWVICGHVVLCENGAPIGGVEVTAFDRDWLQDDPLGTVQTDADGRFTIYYTRADFAPGTFVDIELFGGPDIYFHVRHPSGAPLLIEPPDTGRAAGRENVGHCFCVELCVDKFEQEDETYPPPVFTHVGSYNHQTGIDSLPGASGLTNGDGRAFYATIRLNGTLPKQFSGGPMEYRFDVREVNAAGIPTSAWTPVDMTQIGRTVIGQLLRYAPAFPTDPNPIKSTSYTINGNPGEPEASVVGGWIRVPQESSTFGPSGFFQPDGNQIRLNTRTLGGWSDVDLTGLATGLDTTSTGQPLAQNRFFSLRMRVRRVGVPASEQVAGVCQQLAVNDTLYDNIVRHPAWMAQNLSNQLGVAMVDIQQLVVGGGCVGIGADLDVLFSAAHPTLGSVSMSMSGPGGPYSFTLPAAVPGQRFGNATPNFVVGDLAPCAYIVTLNVQVLLTTGDFHPDNLFDQIAFCKV